jgi:ubiquinone/menaquinone biosynthesis C-methylase UbiE
MSDSSAPDYALQLSAPELERYRMMANAAREAETELWQLAGLGPGAVVADVGCGPGAMFPAVVAAVGENGRVVGVDGVESTVAQAQALVDANGWPNVSVQVGQADKSGLAPESFDAVMMRHVLAHNGQHEQAIVEHLATLVKPDGHVYLVDAYFPGFALRPTEPEIDELSAAYLRLHQGRGNDLNTGFRLDELIRKAGLELIAFRGWYNIVQPAGEVRPPAWAARDALVAAGLATAADIKRWEAAIERLNEQRPTVFAALFGAVGRRP